MANGNRHLPHIYLSAHGQREAFTSPRGGGGKLALPERDRDAHAARLERALARALLQADAQAAAREPAIPTEVRGFYLEFEIPIAQAAVLDKLEARARRGTGIDLVAVRPTGDRQEKLAATVFVPERYRDTFGNKIAAYRDRGHDTRSGKPRNQPLIDSIDAVRLADGRSLFTEPDVAFPSEDQLVWWEVWLRTGGRARFLAAATALELAVREDWVLFVEREVVLVHATAGAIERIIASGDAIAELRLARDTPSAVLGLAVERQAALADALAQRIVPPAPDAPVVTILDTGSTPAHPLLAPALHADDLHAHERDWGGDDRQGHGTMMSGTILYGDLSPILRENAPLVVPHRIESVKILPNAGANDPRLYGFITASAVSTAEIAAPNRPRVVCLAVTSDPHSWRGRPTQWSAEVDNLAYGAGADQRLFLISAGNIRDSLRASDYLARNDASPVENPGQAWNALTIGAVTERTTIVHRDYQGWHVVATAGDLGPSSRTSVPFGDDWPIKPDVVFEGGNFATPDEASDAMLIDDLGLLTTHYRLAQGPFAVTGETSAATALASGMAARVLADRPILWPETVRGVIVHAAEWTDAMLSHLPSKSRRRQSHWRTMVRRYGWGVPDIDRALRSLSNDTTLIIEGELTPFAREDGAATTKEMGLHELPWPTQDLEALGQSAPMTDVDLRVTLSYFIEPNPGERGWTKRHQYASHGLRFEIRRAGESLERFRKRVNKAARADGEKIRATDADKGWTLGPTLRDKGSIHSDLWRGPAALLATRDAIAVYPVGGWWKEQSALRWSDRVVRYALLVTLRVPAGIDIHTPMSAAAARLTTQIAIPVGARP